MSDEIRVGDRFEITVEVVDWPNEDTPYYTVRVVSPGVARAGFDMPDCELRTGRRLPRPIKVGDPVHYQGTRAKVMAIDGVEAWVKIGANRGNTTLDLSDLTPIPGDRP